MKEAADNVTDVRADPRSKFPEATVSHAVVCISDSDTGNPNEDS